MTRDADDPPQGHYFDDDPAAPSDPADVDVVLPDVAFTMRTDRGVFSRGHLDVGTSMLLRSEPPLAPDGHLLDLGCGTGAIALTMALRAPRATVWAVDVNERALDLTAANAARADVPNIRTSLPDDVPDDVRFATIWSNPPIRIGKPALRSLLERWLVRLADDGSATLVVQKHLGADSLQRWLTDHGFPTERRASKSGFRLLLVRPTPPEI